MSFEKLSFKGSNNDYILKVDPTNNQKIMSFNNNELNRTSSINDQIKLYKNIYFNTFYIKITDNGEGMEEGNVKKLFQNFVKLGDNSEANPTGTGLGLSICK